MPREPHLATIKTDVPVEAKAQWESWCKARGVMQREAMRRLLEHFNGLPEDMKLLVLNIVPPASRRALVRQLLRSIAQDGE